MTAVTGPLLRSRQSRHFAIAGSAFTAGPPPRFPRYLAASAGRFPNKHAGGPSPSDGRVRLTLEGRLKALRHGVVDPWMRTVGEQLQALPFGGAALPATFFEPMLTESQTLFRQSSLRLRYQAWRRLRFLLRLGGAVGLAAGI